MIHTLTHTHTNYAHLGIQFGGVRSTSQAANNFIGTGLFMLEKRSMRCTFSVIFYLSRIFHKTPCTDFKLFSIFSFTRATPKSGYHWHNFITATRNNTRHTIITFAQLLRTDTHTQTHSATSYTARTQAGG